MPPDGVMDPPEQGFYTILVEGNIGCGKSTLLDYFNAKPRCEVLSEPVAAWKDVNGHNMLDLMYKDPSRWSGLFQSYAMLTMLCNHTRHTDNPIQIIERSVHSGRWCFIKNLHDSGFMPKVEESILDETYKEFSFRETAQCQLIIYLRASPAVCQQRIKMRCRDEETDIPLSYLESLHELHDNWLLKKTTGTLPAPVIVIDADCDLSQLTSSYDAMHTDWCDALDAGRSIASVAYDLGG